MRQQRDSSQKTQARQEVCWNKRAEIMIEISNILIALNAVNPVNKFIVVD